MVDFGVDVLRPVAMGIDLHRGHLDPEVATMPLPKSKCEAVVAANKQFFDNCRSRGIPVLHLLTSFRDVTEIRTNPFWRTRADDPNATRKNVERHNLEHLPGTTIMPELYEEGDLVVRTKKRYDCFIGSDLEFALSKHGFNTLLITGVNTNSCVLSTTSAACSRDYVPIVISDCVDTMDGEALHEAALMCIRTALGWVYSSKDVFAVISSA